MKKALSLLMASVLALSLAACGSSANTTGESASTADAAETQESAAQSTDAAGTTYKIGICQLVQHDALDAATQGFKDAIVEKLGEENVDFDEQNASGDTANCSTIINGFVSSDVDLIPEEPFDQETQVITLIEHLKFMLSNDSFVISCEDEEHLLESLDLITDDGVDLRDGTEIVSVVDTDHEHSEKFCFSLTVEGEPYPMKLRKIDCGGCPGYLHLWDGLIQQGDRLWNEGMKDQNSRIAKELKLSLLGKIRELAALIICKVDEDDLSVAPMKKQIKDFELVNTECEEERKSAKGDDDE